MNNFEVVSSFEDAIKKELTEGANDKEIQYINNLFENGVCFYARRDVNEITGLTITSQYPEEYKGFCLKIDNIQFNITKALFLAFETAIDFEVPQNVIGYIKLALKALVKLLLVSTVEINDKECVLLYYLYRSNAHNAPIFENRILDDINNELLKLSRDEYFISIKRLQKLKIVTIEDNQVFLKDRIIIKY